MRAMRGMRQVAVIASTLAGAPCAADVPHPGVVLSVRYAAQGPGLTLSSQPEAAFHCARAHTTIVCTARVPRGSVTTLRARTVAPAGSAGANALAFPIDGKAWGGACAGTPADVCRLRATHALTVRIDTRDQ